MDNLPMDQQMPWGTEREAAYLSLLDERDRLLLQVQTLRAEVELQVKHAKEGWDLANIRAGQRQDALLQNHAMREALEEIVLGKGPFSLDRFEHASNTIESMKAVAKEALTQKQKCEHKWAHIEDHHVICEKCKHTADLCWTCEAEKENVNGRLVCPKCVEKRKGESVAETLLNRCSCGYAPALCQIHHPGATPF